MLEDCRVDEEFFYRTRITTDSSLDWISWIQIALFALFWKEDE